MGTYLAIGDSFSEGLNDRAPGGGFAGWADRLAEHLDAARPDGAPPLRYGNTAVRGKLLGQIVRDQVPIAERFAPDLVTIAGGGNDILRPGADPDALAELFEQGVRRMSRTSHVLLFTGFDTRNSPLLNLLRGKVAAYNMHLRAIADRNGCSVVDLWSMRALHDRRAWSEDRLHLAPEGHRRVALRAAQVLGAKADGDPEEPWPAQRPKPAGVRRRENIDWARTHLVPWIGRRLKGTSSGDTVLPKRPEMTPLR
ncbi:SGNH hydrolase [Mangrovactinospora gilvigrisea]|uniref:SGNH hydrolase n=1 Tax=Mangrovactinospora gilvigrisea TaxID=1428644 RepID=A0A1J7BFP8_9ACTN|nr:SGNH hydrolase [Mangrovactinospora gilvigrisea]